MRYWQRAWPQFRGAGRCDALRREEEPRTPFAKTQVFEAGVDPRPVLPRHRSVAWPLPEFVAASRGLGLASVLTEPGGITRRIPVVLSGRSGADAEISVAEPAGWTTQRVRE
jgi:hypothetical protein